MNKVTLYEIAHQYQADFEKLNDLDLTPEAYDDTLESISGDLQEKTQNLVMFMRNRQVTIDAIDDAIKQMTARKRALQNSNERLSAYLLSAMKDNGISRIECPYFVISIAKNPPAVDIYDPAQIPPAYLTDPPPPAPQPDKKLIAAAIKDGFEVAGARLKQGERLSIK